MSKPRFSFRATCNGEKPLSSAASTYAPAAIKARIISGFSLLNAAKCRGVRPSGPTAEESAPPASSDDSRLTSSPPATLWIDDCACGLRVPALNIKTRATAVIVLNRLSSRFDFAVSIRIANDLLRGVIVFLSCSFFCGITTNPTQLVETYVNEDSNSHNTYDIPKGVLGLGALAKSVISRCVMSFPCSSGVSVRNGVLLAALEQLCT